MSLPEGPKFRIELIDRSEAERLINISAEIERKSLPIDEMTDLISRMHGRWCLPQGKFQKKADVDIVQKWIRLCRGYLKSGDSLNRLKSEGAVCSSDIEPIMCRSYLERVYKEHNERNNGLTVFNSEQIQAASRAFEALISDGNVPMLFGDPGSAKDLWYKCFIHHAYHTLLDSSYIPAKIFPDQP